ncbi:MAG: hypothetical protein Q7T54_00975 [Candidatus Levybacteria bacterium]|nr:hypothetical protein [Candidatus Levybacteria bacterium]
MDQDKVVPQPISPNPTQQPPAPQPIVIHKRNNAPLVGAIVFLAIVIAATAIFFGMQNKDTQTTLAPSPTTIPTEIPTPTTVIAAPNQIVFTSPKMQDLAFAQYIVSYPQDWVKEEKKDELTNTLTLTKNGNEIEIHQGPMGGNQCIFEGEVPDGPANDYRTSEFVELKAGEITLRRLVSASGTGGKTAYSLCSNSTTSATSFGIPTVFGVITYSITSPSEEALNEMDAILTTLKIVPKPPK